MFVKLIDYCLLCFRWTPNQCKNLADGLGPGMHAFCYLDIKDNERLNESFLQLGFQERDWLRRTEKSGCHMLHELAPTGPIPHRNFPESA